MSLTTFQRSNGHFLLVLVASSVVLLACLYLLIRAYRRKRHCKGKQRELQRPFIKGKRGSISPRRSPLLFGSLRFTDGQTGSPSKRQRHSPIPLRSISPLINNKASVQRNFLCDAITSNNKPHSRKSPLHEMEKVTSPQKKAEPKVALKNHHPQSPSKESDGCGAEPEDMAEAHIIFNRDYEGDIYAKQGAKHALTEVTTNISAPKETESKASEAQSSPKASNKQVMSSWTNQIVKQNLLRPSLFSDPPGKIHVTSHKQEPRWSHYFHSGNTVEKARDEKYHKKTVSVRTEMAEKYDLNDSHSSLSHGDLEGKCDTIVSSMNSLIKSPIYSSSNNGSIKGDGNLLDSNCDTCSLDNILRDSKSKSHRKKDRTNSRSSEKESTSACSHGTSVVNDIVANASKTEVVCAQCGITLPKPQCFYSLGSLFTDGETCETDSDDINRHPVGDIDDDPPLVDVQSHHDTGYTSSDDFENESTFSKELDQVWSHDKRETDSYDGDYESDNEETAFKPDSLSDDKALKPLVSVGEPVPIKDYALREWKSDTPTSTAMKKGYCCISSLTGCQHLRQIRGDNYCAIRAVLFQVLAGRLPVLNLFASDEKSRLEKICTSHAFLDQWSFANRLPVPKKEIRATLEKFLVFFSHQIRKICDILSQPERIESTLSLLNNETEEFKILEATKLLMYDAAVHLYTRLSRGQDVPVFAMLLFARDSCESPRGLLTNHLNRTGDTGGLEQVEMCLLGYTLGVVIQVIRPSQVDKEDFIASYPSLDDALKYTPTVTLVAEDDRHYNIVM